MMNDGSFSKKSEKRPELPVTLPISRIVDEADSARSFYFSHSLGALPGQFVMLWIPGIDSKPFSVSSCDDKMFSVLVCKVGPFTERMFELKPGDTLGIFGPYGTYFDIEGCKSIITVGGGFGTAPLAYLAEKAVTGGMHVDFIIGGRSKGSILFEKQMKRLGAGAIITTDDGSYGRKGLATDALKDVLERKKGSMGCKVFTCGPELMMLNVMKICLQYDVPMELSLERYMKCGFGICGQCCVDDLGIRMCKEGPVISGELAGNIREFGKYHRDSTGKKVFY